MSQQKRLSQKERMFIELYKNKTIQRNHPFSPRIMNFIQRKNDLVEMGFMITKTQDEYKGKDRYTAYTLDKTHIEIDVPRKKLFGLF